MQNTIIVSQIKHYYISNSSCINTFTGHQWTARKFILMIVICYPQMEILLIKESRHRLVPGIFMINFLIGVIRLPALCRSGISFIIASLHFEELTIAIATSLQVRRILFNLLPPATKLGQGYFFTGVCDSVQRAGACVVARGTRVVARGNV